MAGYNPYDYNYIPQYGQYNQYSQYQQPQYNMYQNYQQQPQQQISYAPLTYVNGIEGAKAYIVAPNQIVYLKDSDSNTLFEKKADAQGKYTLNAYELTAIKLDDVGKKSVSEQENTSFKTDLKTLQDKLDKITALLEAKGEE